MNKFINFFFYLILSFCLIACGSKSENQNETSGAEAIPTEEVVDITEENLKQSKQDLLQQMANDLYLEAEKELEEAPALKMDQRGIYDDISPVEVEIDTANIPGFDLDIEPQEDPEKIIQD